MTAIDLINGISINYALTYSPKRTPVKSKILYVVDHYSLVEVRDGLGGVIDSMKKILNWFPNPAQQNQGIGVIISKFDSKANLSPAEEFVNFQLKEDDGKDGKKEETFLLGSYGKFIDPVSNPEKKESPQVFGFYKPLAEGSLEKPFDNIQGLMAFIRTNPVVNIQMVPQYIQRVETLLERINKSFIAMAYEKFIEFTTSVSIIHAQDHQSLLKNMSTQAREIEKFIPDVKEREKTYTAWGEFFKRILDDVNAAPDHHTFFVLRKHLETLPRSPYLKSDFMITFKNTLTSFDQAEPIIGVIHLAGHPLYVGLEKKKITFVFEKLSDDFKQYLFKIKELNTSIVKFQSDKLKAEIAREMERKKEEEKLEKERQAQLIEAKRLEEDKRKKEEERIQRESQQRLEEEKKKLRLIEVQREKERQIEEERQAKLVEARRDFVKEQTARLNALVEKEKQAKLEEARRLAEMRKKTQEAQIEKEHQDRLEETKRLAEKKRKDEEEKIEKETKKKLEDEQKALQVIEEKRETERQESVVRQTTIVQEEQKKHNYLSKETKRNAAGATALLGGFVAGALQIAGFCSIQ